MPKLSNDRHLLGFDYGRKYIGVAVGQLITKTAMPLTTLICRQQEPDWQHIASLLREWDIQAIVVGLPLNMDGSEQAISQHAKEFIEQLKQRYSLPVYDVDERLSTVYAKSELFEQGGYKALSKPKVDSEAAKIILEQWMKNYG